MFLSFTELIQVVTASVIGGGIIYHLILMWIGVFKDAHKGKYGK